MKGKTHLMARIIAISVITFAVAAPAAHSADWQTSVNGYTIQCNVSDIETIGGVWQAFKITYTFCDNNYWQLMCRSAPVAYTFNGVVMCQKGDGPYKQICKGATYDRDYQQGTFKLNAGTPNAQNYVCDKLFRSMNVTVTPLN
jgi:hypothetical protein